MNSAELHLYLFVKLHDRNDVPSGFWIIGYFCMKNLSAMVVFKVVILQLFSREDRALFTHDQASQQRPYEQNWSLDQFPRKENHIDLFTKQTYLKN